MLLGAAAVPYTYVGKGRRPKGSANTPRIVADARFLDGRLDASNRMAGIDLPKGVYLVGYTPAVFSRLQVS